MSPIEITSAPLYTKEIQQKYYSQFPQLQIRRGPAVDDRTRTTERVPYERFHMYSVVCTRTQQFVYTHL
jgi:hypothetical protein